MNKKGFFVAVLCAVFGTIGIYAQSTEKKKYCETWKHIAYNKGKGQPGLGIYEKIPEDVMIKLRSALGKPF